MLGLDVSMRITAGRVLVGITLKVSVRPTIEKISMRATMVKVSMRVTLLKPPMRTSVVNVLTGIIAGYVQIVVVITTTIVFFFLV